MAQKNLIPSLEELADRFEQNLGETLDDLEEAAKAVNDLARAEHDYGRYRAATEHELLSTDQVKGSNAEQRKIALEALVNANKQIIEAQEEMIAARKDLLELRASLDQLKEERGVLGALLRIRDLYDAAERRRQREQRRRERPRRVGGPWQQRWPR